MTAAVETQSFAEWERAFVLHRIRILIWLSLAVIGTYIAVTFMAPGSGWPSLRYFVLAELLMLAFLVVRETPLVRRHFDLALVASTATRWFNHEGDILRYVFFHSIALACLVGIFVTMQAYVWPFTTMVIH